MMKKKAGSEEKTESFDHAVKEDSKAPMDTKEVQNTPEDTEEASKTPEDTNLLVEEVKRLSEEVATMKDQALRAMAEAENVRTRTRREKEDTLRYAAAGIAKDLLSVADNLRRAMDVVPEDQRQNEAVAKLLDGVKMTEKTLLDAFNKHNIRRIDPLGEKLDPHLHEAMVELEDDSKPSGTVAQVFEAGYVIHDRLLRPARVGVAKGTHTAKTDNDTET